METKNNEMVEVKNSTLSNNESETISMDRFNEIFKEMKETAEYDGQIWAEMDDWDEDEEYYNDYGEGRKITDHWVSNVMEDIRELTEFKSDEEEELFWEKFEEDEACNCKELAEAAAIAYAKEKDCDWDWFDRNYEEMSFRKYNDEYDREKRYSFTGYWADEKELIFNHLAAGGSLQLNEDTLIDGSVYNDTIEDQDDLYERTKEVVDEFFDEDNEDIEELDSDQQFWRSTENERSWMTGGDKLNQSIQDMWETMDCDQEPDAEENCGIYGDILRIIF